MEKSCPFENPYVMKMKLFLYSLIGIFALSACGNSKANENNQDEMKKDKILVAYFSATGTTKKVAEDIAKVFDATLFEIEPAQPYTEEDLDWQNENSRTSIEMHKDLSIRPEIKDKVKDIDQYDVVFLGYPIWWYIAPTIINTFLDENNLEGKTVYCFATSGGSPIEPCVENLQKQYPKINWKAGKLLNNATLQEIEAWKTQICQ